MIPVAVPADPERVVVDLLTAALATAGEAATVGVVVPTDWTTAATDHVQVALDGTPTVQYPALWRATIRVTTWSGTPTGAKSLANLSLALLASYEGDRDVFSMRPLTGVLPAQDPDTRAHLASVTVQVNLRGTVLA